MSISLKMSKSLLFMFELRTGVFAESWANMFYRRFMSTSLLSTLLYGFNFENNCCLFGVSIWSLKLNCSCFFSWDRIDDDGMARLSRTWFDSLDGSGEVGELCALWLGSMANGLKIVCVKIFWSGGWSCKFDFVLLWWDMGVQFMLRC